MEQAPPRPELDCASQQLQAMTRFFAEIAMTLTCRT